LTRDYEHFAYNVNGLLAYRFADNVTLTANGGYSQLQGIVLSGIGTLQAEGFGYTYGQLRLVAGDLFAQVYVNRNNAGDSFVYGTGMPVVDNGVFYNAQAQYNWLVNANQSVIFGVDGQFTTPDTEGTILGRNEGENITEAGVYAQSQTRLTEQVDVTVALRADYNDVVDAVRLSPRAAVVSSQPRRSRFARPSTVHSPPRARTRTSSTLWREHRMQLCLLPSAPGAPPTALPGNATPHTERSRIRIS
jgi:outer membrane receptor for ferrienterochelin and colicins